MRVDEGCAVGGVCAAGDIEACYGGDPAQINVGVCREGGRVCAVGPDGATAWGPCEGEVHPSPEVCNDGADNDCDGRSDCDDGACSGLPECRSHFCSVGGTWEVRDNWYRCNGDRLGSYCVAGASCTTWSSGGAFSANCAGSYRLCLRAQTSGTTCTVAERCVDVSIATDGGWTSLPPFGAWTWGSSPCPTGQNVSACLRLTGTTTDGRPISRELGCFSHACDNCQGTRPECGGGASAGGAGGW